MKFFKKMTDSFLNLFKLNTKDAEVKIDQKIEVAEASIKTESSSDSGVKIADEVPAIEVVIEPVAVEPLVEVPVIEAPKVETVKDIKSQTKKPVEVEKPKSKKPKRKPKKKQEDK